MDKDGTAKKLADSFVRPIALAAHQNGQLVNPVNQLRSARCIKASTGRRTTYWPCMMAGFGMASAFEVDEYTTTSNPVVPVIE